MTVDAKKCICGNMFGSAACLNAHAMRLETVVHECERCAKVNGERMREREDRERQRLPR